MSRPSTKEPGWNPDSGRRKPPGAAPGTVIFTGGKKTDVVSMQVCTYDPESFLFQDLEQAPQKERIEQLEFGESNLWLNVNGLHDTEFVQSFGPRFGLHPLVLEDVVSVYQRPKVEEYAEHLFIVLRMLKVSDLGRITSEQVSFVLGRGYLLTFQEQPGDVFKVVRDRLRKEGSRIRGSRPDYLAYALVDAVVDHYFVVLEQLADRTEALETKLLGSVDEAVMKEIHALKQQLLYVRKTVWPLREMVSNLARTESKLVTDMTRTFLRDVYDHAVQAIDTVESLRDTAASLMDLYLSSVSNRMNEVMKVLTIMSSLFIPLSFLAGLYGMNFDHMPELHLRWAYPVLLGVMGVVVAGLLTFFRRKRWI